MERKSTFAAATTRIRSQGSFADGTDVDIVVAKWKWEADLIDRAESMSIGGVAIRVPRTGDLILLKLAAGGFIDLQDAKALMSLGDVATVIRDVEAHVAEVRPDVRALWSDLRAASER